MAMQATKGLHGKVLKNSLALVESAEATYEDCRHMGAHPKPKRDRFTVRVQDTKLSDFPLDAAP